MEPHLPAIQRGTVGAEELIAVRVLITDHDVWVALDAGAAQLPADVSAVYLPLSRRSEILDVLPSTDAYAGVQFDAGFAAAATRLRLLHITAAGTDHIPIAGVAASATIVNSYGHGRSVAEHVVMTMLAVRRGLVWRDCELRSGRWRSRMVDPSVPRFGTLEGATVAIVGTGHIGAPTADLCVALGTRVVGVHGRDVSVPALNHGPWAWLGGPRHLHDACREADYLVLACPLTDRTRDMIGAAELSLLGGDGVLVNVGRGGLVDEHALFAALRYNAIAGAALDVWQTDASAEPHPASQLPFHELINVVMTPHYSASAESTYVRRAWELAASLRAIAAGTPPANCVRAPIEGALS